MKLLGGGSAYEVFLVWDEHCFSLMVAKVLRPDRTEDEGELRSLDNEIEALASLDHPVLVRGFDADMEGPHPHVLIEHLEGPTLRAVLKRHGSLEIEQLVPLALNVAGATQYMANEGWVHLDVKPDNIVLGVPPRLIDLSVARTLERAERIRRPVGTDAYMAPEQCDPAAMPGAIGPPADVFGLAATLFHAVAGRAPFPRPKGARDSDDPAVRFPQLHQPPGDLPPKTPGPLADAIHAGLAHDPAERPTAAQIVAMLEPVLAALAAYAWLAEELAPVQIAGALIVLVGVGIAQTARPPTART
jgi:serine/threonine protein kinase